MAQVQDEALSLSKTILFTEARSAQHTLRNSTEVLLKKMERVRQRIEQVRYHTCLCSFQPPYLPSPKECKAHRVAIDSIITIDLLEGA
jgi:hypothetical protein